MANPIAGLAADGKITTEECLKNAGAIAQYSRDQAAAPIEGLGKVLGAAAGVAAIVCSAGSATPFVLGAVAGACALDANAIKGADGLELAGQAVSVAGQVDKASQAGQKAPSPQSSPTLLGESNRTEKPSLGVSPLKLDPEFQEPKGELSPASTAMLLNHSDKLTA